MYTNFSNDEEAKDKTSLDVRLNTKGFSIGISNWEKFIACASIELHEIIPDSDSKYCITLDDPFEVLPITSYYSKDISLDFSCYNTDGHTQNDDSQNIDKDSNDDYKLN